MSTIDNKIIEEIKRYNNINKYIMEQDVPTALPDEDPAAGGEVPPPQDPAAATTTGDTPEPVDVENDPDVEKISGEGSAEDTKKDETESDSEELDITDLVNAQKSNNEKQDNYFTELFGHLEKMEEKLGEMDNLVSKINSLEEKIEKYRPKTPQEKLELRSLDSGPYNQKLTDFFIDKEPDMEKSGKNEYILTTDDVENFTPSEIRTSFNPETPKTLGI